MESESIFELVSLFNAITNSFKEISDADGGSLDGLFQNLGSLTEKLNVVPIGTKPESVLWAKVLHVLWISEFSSLYKWRILLMAGKACGPQISILPKEYLQSLMVVFDL